MPDEPSFDLADLPGVSTRDRVFDALAVVRADPVSLIAGLLLVAGVVVAVVLSRGGGDTPDLVVPMAVPEAIELAPPTAPTTVPADVVVHAAGAVETPGLYVLAAGSRVADLIDAAGGVSFAADLNRVNLASPLRDGERVFVPTVGQPVPGVVAGETASSAGAGPVDINSASGAELEDLPGIGPATATAIVEHRSRTGPFRSVDDLLEVRGIGEAKLEQLRAHVTV